MTDVIPDSSSGMSGEPLSMVLPARIDGDGDSRTRNLAFTHGLVFLETLRDEVNDSGQQ